MAHAHVMDRACHQFLAGARLALHQHWRHAARDLFHQGAHVAHGHRVAGHARQRVAPCSSLRQRRRCDDDGRRPGRRCARGTGWPVLGGQLVGLDRRSARCRAPECRSDHAAEQLEVHRLGEVVVGACLQRLDRAFRRAVGGDHDRLLAPSGFLQAAQEVEPAAVGQPHVGDHGAEGPVLELQPGFLDRAGNLDVVALAQQRQLVERAQIGLVVDDQQAEVGCGAHDIRWSRAWSSASEARCIETLNSLP